MNDRLPRSLAFGRLTAAGLAACGTLLAAPAAFAYVFWLGGFYPPALPIWFVRCNDGYTLLMPPGMDLPTVMNLAQNVYCAMHGGVADVTDSSVTTALQEVAGPSSLVLGRDLGGGRYEVLTSQEVEQLAAAAGPNGSELVDVELLSLVVGGTELLPNPTPLPGSLPLFEIYSNEDDTGPDVGGPIPPLVPLSPEAGWVLGLALLAAGAFALGRSARRGASSGAAG